MAEIGHIEVESEDAIPDLTGLPEDHFKDGRYKWPKAIFMSRAWRFEPPIENWRDVMGENWKNNFTAAQDNAIKLSSEEQRAILDYPYKEIELNLTDHIERIKKEKRVIDAAIEKIHSDDDWRQFISQTTGRILNRVKSNNGQEIKRVAKSKTTDMDEGGMQVELQKLLDSQKKQCAITGRDLILGDKWLQPSIDRIDSSKWCIRGNLQITTWAANMAKSDLAPEEVDIYFESLQFFEK